MMLFAGILVQENDRTDTEPFDSAQDKPIPGGGVSKWDVPNHRYVPFEFYSTKVLVLLYQSSGEVTLASVRQQDIDVLACEFWALCYLGGGIEGGTCAGLIMLDKDHLNTMDITVRRNAYGHQLGSFCCEGDFKGIGRVPMTFIRAPYIEGVGKDTSTSSAQAVEILSVHDNHIVAARQGNQLVTAFHPELSNSMVIHQYYIETLCTRNK